MFLVSYPFNGSKALDENNATKILQFWTNYLKSTKVYNIRQDDVERAATLDNLIKTLFRSKQYPV